MRKYLVTFLENGEPKIAIEVFGTDKYAVEALATSMAEDLPVNAFCLDSGEVRVSWTVNITEV